MPAVIGITCSWDNENEKHYLNSSYAGAVKAAGGLPVLLVDYEKQEIQKLLGLLDGLLLSGGKDVDPVYFGEDMLPGCGEITPVRDAFEIEFTRLALNAGLPVLGICRGAQVLNIAAGGNIYQDLITQLPGRLKHHQLAPAWAPTHNIQVEAGTLLENILQIGVIRVNSFHHQAVRDVAPGFVVSARSPDGIIEAIESACAAFALGVQCHPEEMWEKDSRFLKLFRALIEAARKSG